MVFKACCNWPIASYVLRYRITPQDNTVVVYAIVKPYLTYPPPVVDGQNSRMWKIVVKTSVSHIDPLLIEWKFHRMNISRRMHISHQIKLDKIATVTHKTGEVACSNLILDIRLLGVTHCGTVPAILVLSNNKKIIVTRPTQNYVGSCSHHLTPKSPFKNHSDHSVTSPHHETFIEVIYVQLFYFSQLRMRNTHSVYRRYLPNSITSYRSQIFLQCNL